MKHIPTLLSLLLLCALPASAQKLFHYDLADGLSSSEITSICENEHYLWIATEDGLNRFDGHRFKVYKSGGGSGIKNNNIETIFLDSRGMLWIGFKTGGVDIYNPRTDKFTHLSEIVPEPIPNRIISIFEDSDHNIWLGSWEEGVCKLTATNDRNPGFKVERSHWGKIVSSFVEKPAGHIWVATYTGLSTYDSHLKRWSDVTPENLTITHIHDSGETGRLYFSSWDNALYEFTWTSRPADAASRILFKGNSPIYRIQGAGDKLIIGTWGEGVKTFDRTQGKAHNMPGTDEIDATFVNAIHKDNVGNIWIGSYGKGLYKYTSADYGISQLLPVKETGSPVTAIAYLCNKLLLGTLGNGLYCYEGLSGRGNRRSSFNDKFKDHILSVGQSDNIILVGHDGIGLQYSFIDPSSTSLAWKEFTPSNELEKVTAFHISDNRVWMGTKQNGLMSATLDPATRSIKDFIHYDSFSRDRINAIVPDGANKLLIASHNGLTIFDIHKRESLKKKIIDNEIVYSIIEDTREKCWWVGTSNNLLRMTSRGDSLVTTVAFPNYPLPHGAIKSLLLDEDDNLWFSIGGRLFCHIAAEDRICEPNISHWGNSAIISARKITSGGKEYLLLGNTERLVAVDVHKLLSQHDFTRLILTELEINHNKIHVGDTIDNSVILNENTEYVPSITLSHASRWISLSFTEIGDAHFLNRYLYRMKGFADTWQYLDMSMPLTFSQLNPGTYTLEIKKYGEEDDAICWSMTIAVTPPWWKTTTFYVIMFLLVFCGIGGLLWFIKVHYRRKSNRRIKDMESMQKVELLKEKESFFEGLTHDLITPLSLILAPANDMLRETPESDNRHERLSIIVKNAAFLSDLFSTILDFKRVELSEVEINNRQVEIVSFCRIIVNAFNYLAASKEITLSYETGMPPTPVMIDSVKFERVLYNLLSNAIKYTPQHGTVTVSLLQENDRLQVFIKDSGPGIMQQYQTKVFNKFYREPQYSGENTPNGLGIGLYVVKKFVTAMNGTVSIDSAPGAGTTLFISLPLAPMPAGIVAVDSSHEVKVSNIDNNRATILLVEDNSQILNYLSVKLSEHFNVVTATNGEEALERIDEYLPEIVVSDIMMAGMDGLTLCRHIKSNSLYADIFVILLTAKTSSEDELRGYKEGADIYIRKPFDTEALISQIMNILTTRQKRKEQLLKNLIAKDSDNIEFNSKEVFLQQALKAIEENLNKADFNIEEFAVALNTSKTVLHKKFKTLIGQTPNQFIRAIRLRKAAELLVNSDLSVAEIAYLTGFNQAHYFIKCFKEVYNETPKTYRDIKRGTV